MLELTVQLIIFLFPLAYSPGPGNMFFAANGARFGFKSTLLANLGYHIATWIMAVLMGLGIGVLLNYIPYFYKIIRYAGSIYVLYLAWRLYSAGALDSKIEPKPIGFWDGVIILMFNPKAYFIIALLSSQFLTEAQTHHFWLVILVSTVFTFNNLAAFMLWTLVGDRLMRLFKSETKAKIMNRFFGIVLFLVAVWMLLS